MVRRSPGQRQPHPGVLYVVATPIGNLEDVTVRALRILKEVDLIAAEDTRHTRKLLVHYAITTRLTSYHDHTEASKTPKLIALLHAGKNVALVSDAGTPGISDPGYRLVNAAAEAGLRVVAVPGPSMVTALLSVGGLPTDRFAFEGFLPAKQGRRRRVLHTLRREPRTLVLYESPHRLVDCLADLAAELGDRRVVIGREVTKQFEEILRGPISEVAATLGQRPVKGEVSLLVEGWNGEEERAAGPSAEDLMQQLLADGTALKEAARTVGETCGLSGREAYALGLRLKAK